jgi:aspartate/methionine/tyrosine aminotransferase
MNIPVFEMERWQSTWENMVELNISESGVLPLAIRELLPDAEERENLLNLRLGYPQSNGTEALRANIARFYPGAKTENVLATTGTAEANFLAAEALLEPGAEIVLMMPNYMQLAGVARGLGAQVKALWLREELRWAFDPADLRKLVTPQTRLIAVCNPNNPTGAVLSEPLMDELCRAAEGAGAFLLADEVYRGAEFSGQLTPTFFGRYDRVVCTAGLSKAFGLPGLRTGWAVGPPDFIQKLWSYKDYSTIAITMPADRLAALALEPARRDAILQRTRQMLRRNYPVLGDWIGAHPDVLRHVPPAAGAIAYIGYRNAWKSRDLAEALRVEKSVLLVPGSQFEMEGYLRIGFGYEAETLRRALERVEEVMLRGARVRAAH